VNRSMFPTYTKPVALLVGEAVAMAEPRRSSPVVSGPRNAPEDY
jgi:hypothetical protein